MNEEKDIRWLQRFDNYRKALLKLKQAVSIVLDKVEDDEYDEIEELLRGIDTAFRIYS